jgi:VanZ family protein
MTPARPSIVRRTLLWGPPLLYAALIFHLSSQPDPFPTIRPAVWDKLLHVTTFAGLALLLSRAFRGEGTRWRVALVLALVLTSAYGASDEWHQSYVPNRDASVNDWHADTIGAAVGVLLARLFLPLAVLTHRSLDI